MLVGNIGENRVYSPIPYPEIFYVVVLPFYLLGDIHGLTFVPPFFSALTALFAYLLFRKINKFAAILTSVLVISINIWRVTVVVPAMEDVLLFAAVASIYFYYRFFRNQKSANLILAALFIGFTAVLKQSGMIFSFSIILHACLSTIWGYLTHKNIIFLKKSLLLILLTLVCSFGPLSEQIVRNGTIDPVPASSLHRFPFLTAKYVGNPQAVSLISEWVGPNYWPKQVFPDFLKSYVVLLLSQNNLLEPEKSVVCNFLIFLFFAGSLYLWKRHRFLFTLLILILAIDLISTYVTQTPISQYHVIGLGVLSLFIPFSIIFFQKMPSPKIYPQLSKYLAITIMALAITLLLYNNVEFFHLRAEKSFQKTNEQNERNINSYNNIAQIIQKGQVSSGAVFLGYSPIFIFYAERDILWLNPMYDLHFPTIAKSTNEEQSLYWLKQSAIEYIILENDQIYLKGFGRYFPSSGLLTYIDQSRYFEKIYDDDNVRVWKISYPHDN
jgi:hypothetical protein